MSTAIDNKDFEQHLDKLYSRISDDIKRGIKPLPDFPGVAARLSDLIQDPNYRASDLVEVLERDENLSQLIIRIASSALYPSQEPCESLSVAVRRMGAETTSNLVLTFCLHNLFRSESKTVQQRLTRIWNTDIQVAATAAWIGQSASGIKAENALFAALLQNVGAYFILSRFGEKIKSDYHWELFNEIILRHGNKLSGRILRKWHMPQNVIDVALSKDEWLREHGSPNADLADVVMVARYHVYLNTSLIKAAPKYTDLPAAQKLKLKKNEATPFQGLKFVHEEKSQIKDITRMLAT